MSLSSGERRQRLGDRRLVMLGAPLGGDAAARARQPRLGDLDGLGEHAVLDARQHGLDQPDLDRPERLDGKGLAAGAQPRRPASTSAAFTANGMIFTVATIWPASTAAYSATVAMVIAGSTRLIASISARSTVKTPAVTACRLTRPVAAGLISTPSIVERRGRCASRLRSRRDRPRRGSRR